MRDVVKMSRFYLCVCTRLFMQMSQDLFPSILLVAQPLNVTTKANIFYL